MHFIYIYHLSICNCVHVLKERYISHTQDNNYKYIPHVPTSYCPRHADKHTYIYTTVYNGVNLPSIIKLLPNKVTFQRRETPIRKSQQQKIITEPNIFKLDIKFWKKTPTQMIQCAMHCILGLRVPSYQSVHCENDLFFVKEIPLNSGRRDSIDAILSWEDHSLGS